MEIFVSKVVLFLNLFQGHQDGYLAELRKHVLLHFFGPAFLPLTRVSEKSITKYVDCPSFGRQD